MRKALSLSLIVLLCGLAGGALAVPRYGRVTHYVVMGTVNGIAQAPSAGRTLVFFRDRNSDGSVSVYTQTTVETVTTASGNYQVSASDNLDLLPLKVGMTYYVAVVQDANGYGAGPQAFTLSGLGFDKPNDLVMAQGKGVVLKPLNQGEPGPVIQLWFGNRLYQPALVSEANPFVITEQPTLKVNLSIAPGYALADKVNGNYSIKLDPNTSSARDLALAEGAMGSKVYAAGVAPSAPQQLTSASLSYSLADPLASGTHNFLVSAQSSGALAAAGVTTLNATVEVIAGPVRLVGTPLTFPSPYSISKDKIVTIQYTLSKNAAIEIILTDISGRRVKTFVADSGSEGGSAGLNKLTWNGKTDLGPLAGNGIYLGIIVAKDEGRKLGSVKVTLLD